MYKYILSRLKRNRDVSQTDTVWVRRLMGLDLVRRWKFIPSKTSWKRRIDNIFPKQREIKSISHEGRRDDRSAFVYLK